MDENILSHVHYSCRHGDQLLPADLLLPAGVLRIDEEVLIYFFITVLYTVRQFPLPVAHFHIFFVE
jgi:hypothetical protein